MMFSSGKTIFQQLKNLSHLILGMLMDAMVGINLLQQLNTQDIFKQVAHQEDIMCVISKIREQMFGTEQMMIGILFK